MTAAYGTIGRVDYGSRTTTTTPVPSGTTDGNHLLLVQVNANSGTAVTVALPTGFTRIAGYTPQSGTDGSFGWRVDIGERIASSEPANYAVTHSSTNTETLMIRSTGSGTLSIDVSSQNHTATNSLTATANGVTPTLTDDLLYFIMLNWDEASRTPPTSMTERQDSQFIYLASQALASASATGNKTMALGSSAPWFANLIAIKDVASSNKTLDANAGSYAIGGTAATLKRNRRIAGDTASYAISGTAATLRRGFKTAADSGSYSISGTAASFVRTWKAIANSGSYSISGTAANLELHRKLVADTASYSISGTAATLRLGKVLAANSGSYSISGTTAALKLARKMAVAGATYSVTGSDATLTKSSDKVVTVDTGIYAITGSDARLAYSHRIMVVEGGSYQIGGYPVDLFKGQPIPRNSLNAKIKYGGPGSIGDLARMGADIELHFPKNENFKDYGPGFWPDQARKGGDVVE